MDSSYPMQYCCTYNISSMDKHHHPIQCSIVVLTILHPCSFFHTDGIIMVLHVFPAIRHTSSLIHMASLSSHSISSQSIACLHFIIHTPSLHQQICASGIPLTGRPVCIPSSLKGTLWDFSFPPARGATEHTTLLSQKPKLGHPQKRHLT